MAVSLNCFIIRYLGELDGEGPLRDYLWERSHIIRSAARGKGGGGGSPMLTLLLNFDRVS